jgi:TolA-binding protein/predicted Ser/Thr protein kinase
VYRGVHIFAVLLRRRAYGHKYAIHYHRKNDQRVMTGCTVTHYRVGEKLGEGGSSVVYRAVDEALGREVVLKLFLADGAAGLARLLHEARTISSLNHPNICTIYEIGQHEGRHFLAMELLDGQVLSDAIRGRPLTIERLVDYGTQIADALDAAHATLIVHRDLKPANIFVTRVGRIKLLDFGVAALLPRRSDLKKAVTSLSSTAGTIPYMSPEQARADELDHRTDLFSFGSVLYEMATGRQPFVGLTAADVRAAIVGHSPAAARTLNSAVPAELDRIIGKALEKDPSFRYQTASDIRADLQRLKRDLTEAQRTATHVTHHVQLLRRVSGLRLAAVASVPALIAVAWLATVAIGRRREVRPTRDVPDATVPSAHIVVPVETAQDSHPVPVIATTTRPRDLAGRAARPAAAPMHAESSAFSRAESRAAAPPPLPTADPSRPAASDPLLVARQQIELKLFDQAIETLRPVGEGPDRRQAIDASFLIAAIHTTRGDTANAMGKYVEIANRFADDPRAAEALFRLAQSTMTSKRRDREREASQILSDLVYKYPTSAVAAQALLMRGDIEAVQGAYRRDDLLGGSIPTAAITYREIVDRYPSAPAAAAALAKLARLYAEAKRFGPAADTFEKLAERDATDPYDAWFQAANLRDKQLKDKVRARAAYSRVPPSSPHYTDAQKRLRP